MSKKLYLSIVAISNNKSNIFKGVLLNRICYNEYMKKHISFLSNELNWKRVLNGVLIGMIVVLAILYALMYIALNFKIA